MRILAFSDIHGAYNRVFTILSRESDFDAIIIGGDLTTHGTPREAEEALQKFKDFGKPLMAVAGNMDPPHLEKIFQKLDVSINGRATILGPLGIFGVSGSPVTPMRTPYEISEEEIMIRAERGWCEAEKAATKIFVPHAPPHNTKVDKIFLGIHVGSKSLRRFIENYQPDVVVCGHIHEARGQDKIGKSQIVNCGPAGKGYYVVLHIRETVRIESKG